MLKFTVFKSSLKAFTNQCFPQFLKCLVCI